MEKGARDIIEICHLLASRGLVAATDGNISTRLPDGTILATRSGINKGMAEESDLVMVGPDGSKLSGGGRPSTELGMHLFVYRERPDVNAIVHAHPITATAFAAARVPLESFVFPEVIMGIGEIPLAPYATPSTPEVAESLRPHVAAAQAILLANHGVVTFGRDVYEAYFRMEKVEQVAHMLLIARQLGGPIGLTREELERLSSARKAQSEGNDR